ncbi:MAG: hypothetical protein CBC29_05615 [Methylococcaceae bacterium TMED69]|nr:MAG: hypothetical protein CBC29_05615 [Methylococcaceae bacterium TMED69]|tara:strand:- start:2756 stop:3292 length:537 start_codon:yes stop_codon:yes gene_type:complete
MPSKFAGGNFPKADGRNDLGYGRSDPKFHTPKKLGSSVYPYEEADEDVSDVEISDETLDAIATKSPHMSDYDPGDHYDPFYFAAGNTKLSERVSKSIGAIPGLHSTGQGEVDPKISKSTTSRNPHGWAKPSPGEKKGWSYLPETGKEDDEPIFNLSDLAKKQVEQDLREWIRLTLLRI